MTAVQKSFKSTQTSYSLALVAELVLVVAVAEACDDLGEARGRDEPGQGGIRNAPFGLLKYSCYKFEFLRSKSFFKFSSLISSFHLESSVES